mmetsp:Transcript_10450/g.28860  ORF Transcript_10450/g.28860 Transcript_10450/m.28860 type:complete len:139 (-) Transcript_10450:405-821(-)
MKVVVWYTLRTLALPVARRFKPSAVVAIMQEVMADKMAYTVDKDKKGRYIWEYDHAETTDVAKEISQECMTKVKDLMGVTPRYKLIFHVAITENIRQSMRIASRCLWDKESDNCATAEWSHPGGIVTAVAMCFALYYE